MHDDSLWNGIKGVVLDAVGTLIEPVPSVTHVYARVAARQGVVLDLKEIRGRFGRHFRDDETNESRGPMITDETIERARWRRIVGNVLPEVPEPSRAFEELWEHFGRAEAWRCYPDVAPALKLMLDAGLHVRIGSNFDCRLRTVVAGLPELSPLAEGLIISSEVGFRKPHPGFYEATCRNLGLPATEILFLGDDPENDVDGPKRAGLRSALIDREGKKSGGFMTILDLIHV